MRSPTGIAWLVAGALGVVIVIVAAPWRSRDDDATSEATVLETARLRSPDEGAGEPAFPAKPKDGREEVTPPETIDPPPPPEVAAVDPAPGDAPKPDARATAPARRAPGSLPAPPHVVAEAELPPDAGPAEPAVAVVPKGPVRDPIDVAARLKQPIASFDQVQAVPLKELLLIVEEMVGVPVRFDGDASDRDSLERPVSVSLTNTTVGGILQSLVDKGNLAFEIRGEEIRLRTKLSAQQER